MSLDEQQRLSEIFRKVRHIEITTERLVKESFSGSYHSAFKGRGMDFDEVREYVAGDEVRFIDWNVTARSGKPFIKKFTEERELNLVIVLDVSGSQEFGSQSVSKRELSAELAGVLAFSAADNQDKVSLLLASDIVEKHLPPQKGRGHILRLVRDALFYKPTHQQSSGAVAIEYLNRVLKRSSMIFLISDFHYPDMQAFEKSLALCSRKHDVVAFHIHDTLESSLPEPVSFLMEDAETGKMMQVNLNHADLLNEFSSQQEQKHTALQKMLAGLGVDYLPISTSDSYVPALNHFFQTRFARQRTR